MPLLLDGNNLFHRLPPQSRSRAAVRSLVLDATRNERVAVVVVFDGPPPAGSPDRERLGPVTVLWSGSTSADDVIIRSIPDGPAARSWTVITDDRGLADRARRRGAAVRRLRQCMGRRKTPPRRPAAESKLSSRELQEWEAYFKSRPAEDE
jgi:hypothetical protein